MFLVRYTSAASLTVQQLEKPTSLAGQLLWYTQTMTKAMWSLLGSAAASRAPSAGSSVVRVISTHSRDTPLPYGMLVLTERSLMMWTMSAGEHELLWEDNLRSRLERQVDESEQSISSTVHLLDAQLVGPTAERYSFVVAVLTGFESQQGMAELRLHTVKCTLGGNQPPEALRLFRLPADGLPLAVFRNQEFYFRTESASLNEPAVQSEFAAYLVLTVDRLVLVTGGSFPLNGGDADEADVQEVPLNKTMTAIPAASLVGAHCVSRQLLLLTGDGTVQAVGESDGGSMAVIQTPVSTREATPVKQTPSTSQQIRQGVVREVDQKVENILRELPEEQIGEALEAASKKIIDEQPAGSQWLDGGEEIERQFVSKALADKKRQHDAFCLALQRHHAWSRFEAAGFAITDNGEKLAAMAVLYDLDQKKRFTSLVGEAISSTLETEVAELAVKGVSMKERFFSESSLIQEAVIQLCKPVKEATSEERIFATAEILLAVLRGALDERQSLHANFSCRYSVQNSWIADSATRAALTEFFQTASKGFHTLAQNEGDVRDRAASSTMTHRPGLVSLLASLARLYFEVFDELMQQQVPVDDEYETAKALVFTMFSELEVLQEAQQQPILAVLKDERKKLAIDFLYFEGMLLCTFETPQQLARLVKDYHATYGTCGRQFAEFAFSWLEKHQQLHTLLQVAEAAPEDAQQFFEDRPHLGWLFHLGRNDELQQVATASFNAAASVGSVQDQKRWLSVSRLAHRLLGQQDQRQAAALDKHISNRLGLIQVHEWVASAEEEVVIPHNLVHRLLERCSSEHADQVAILGRALAVIDMADGLAGDIDAAEGSDGYGDWSLVRDAFRADVQRCWETAIRVDLEAWLEKLAERQQGHSEELIRDFLVEQTVFGKVRSVARLTVRMAAESHDGRLDDVRLLRCAVGFVLAQREFAAQLRALPASRRQAVGGAGPSTQGWRGGRPVARSAPHGRECVCLVGSSRVNFRKQPMTFDNKNRWPSIFSLWEHRESLRSIRRIDDRLQVLWG